MPRTKFQEAHVLIQEGRYDAARAILQTIADPRANEWLAKLDRLEHPKSSVKQTRTIVEYPRYKPIPLTEIRSSKYSRGIPTGYPMYGNNSAKNLPSGLQHEKTASIGQMILAAILLILIP